ncbi:MAG: HypC/HybG/HupF family hydrogenase formation chaperone [Deltaproteobacteria bacterium]|nr:MAG: HypC/HybG/HupF family hydrogenase formation chaperone [Deltaproteobacteria bacterium]
MCLAVPMELVEIKDNIGVARMGEVGIEVHLGLLGDVKLGDYLIVHAGFAIQKLDKEAAEETLTLLNELLEEAE